MSDNTNPELDWQKALDHLQEVTNGYAMLIGLRDVNPYFALTMIGQLKQRYIDGERSRDLYDQIMGVE